jgi:PQQ-like domain
MRPISRTAAICLAASCVGLISSCSASSSHPPSHSAAKPVPSSTSTTTPPTSASEASNQWTTYGGNLARTSDDSTDPARTKAPAEVWTSQSVDGDVYGEPLVYHGAVYVATENDTVYGFSETNGSQLWTPDHLASPAPASALPCGDISPTVGITSTMVIDPSNGDLFASAETYSDATVGHYLFAIDASTGKVLWGRDVDQSWQPPTQLQRTGLGISDGRVLMGFGGNFGDCGDYNGWVLGVPESGSGPILSYRVPTVRQGAVWAPSGVSVDSSGDVYFATGNGSAVAGQPFDHGDAVIKLSPQLQELSYFAPTNWAELNADDLDLGSTAPVLLGNGQLFEIGKGGTGYLVDTSSLGGLGGELTSLGLCFSMGGSAYLAPNVYVICLSNGSIEQVRVGPGNALHTGWTWASPSGTPSSPTIAGGYLWSIDQSASMLYGVDLTNGTTAYSVALHVGSLVHFVAPSATGGMLFVAGSGGVEAFR